MIDRTVESAGTLTQAKENGVGFTAFSPLEQGMLTDRYINGIPEDSRVLLKINFSSKRKSLQNGSIN